MLYPAVYCSIRKALESKVQVLLATHSALTSVLCTAIGRPREWTDAHDRCRFAYHDLVGCKQRLRSHRAKHGC